MYMRGGIDMAITNVKYNGTAIVVEDTVAQTKIGNLSNLQTTAKSDLVSAINEAMENGGLDLSDLTLTATQSPTSGFSTLTLFDGETRKAVDIPVASLSDSDTTLITNLVDAYLDNLVNGDGVSY